MSVTNDSLRRAMAFIVTPEWSNLSANFATGAGAQSQGLPLQGEMNGINNSVATGACVLRSITTGEAPALVIVINDSLNSINVGASAGEKVNGVATTSSFGAGVLAVASGGFGIFLATGSLGKSGGNPATTQDWRAAAFT
jgi:hypothetical protein